jgi:hypothetical protein
MNRSDTITELAVALAKAQGTMKAAEMNAVNPFLHNSYADLGSVIEAARPALTANGLSFVQAPAITEAGITLETLILHASGQWLASSMTLPVDDKKGLSSAQAAGSVITYLRRYALAAMLGIYADKDEDGNEKQTTTTTTPTQQTTTQKPAPTNGNGNQNAEPKCPKCGGPMWDNRAKIAETGKKMPEWSCKAGKWNAATKQKEGCDGVRWPTEPSAEAEFDSIPTAQEERGTPRPGQRLAELRTGLYADKAAKFASEFAAYKDTKQGGPDHGHIRGALLSLGYADITNDNIDAAFQKLAEHALSAEADAVSGK